MAIVATVPSAVYQPGARVYGPATIPQGATGIRTTFTRESWPLTIADPVLSVLLEASYDGGVTWPEFAGGTWNGGVRVAHGSTVLSESVATFNLDSPQSLLRRVRASVIVISALRTTVTLEVF